MTEGPRDFVTPLAASAMAFHELYEAYKRVGFTHGEAIYIAIEFTKEGMRFAMNQNKPGPT